MGRNDKAAKHAAKSARKRRRDRTRRRVEDRKALKRKWSTEGNADEGGESSELRAETEPTLQGQHVFNDPRKSKTMEDNSDERDD